MTMFLVVPPAPALSPYVAGYWFVQDLLGVYEGQPIRTSPHPGAVLSFNFGRPNAMDGGPVVPSASLLGIQTVARRWRSWADTYFVMAMLTVRGLVRLFPSTGPGTSDRLVELAAVIGSPTVTRAHVDLRAGWDPAVVRARLDAWLLGRLERTRAPAELARLCLAHQRLQAGDSVQEAAAVAEVSRRQLGRWCRAHLGIGPKRLMDLERLQSSVRAAQCGRGDPTQGFSDQAHQIRTWRRRLGVTPSAYARGAPSVLASYFGGSDEDAPMFYL
ncbi:MAG: helix-turn-helix domain-containing protein [Myxococcota bacterium]